MHIIIGIVVFVVGGLILLSILRKIIWSISSGIDSVHSKHQENINKKQQQIDQENQLKMFKSFKKICPLCKQETFVIKQHKHYSYKTNQFYWEHIKFCTNCGCVEVGTELMADEGRNNQILKLVDSWYKPAYIQYRSVTPEEMKTIFELV